MPIVYVFIFTFMLPACGVNHSIYGGFGKQINDVTDEWNREGQTYGKVGYRASKRLHERDKVDIYGDIHHKSHPGRRDRGEENFEVGFEKHF